MECDSSIIFGLMNSKVDVNSCKIKSMRIVQNLSADSIHSAFFFFF